MSFGTRLAATLAAIPLMALPAACGGGDQELRATLTDDGCRYEGTATPAAPMFTISIENQTEYFGALALAALAPGSTIDDLEPWLARARAQFKRSGTPTSGR